ncbi:hypothetical protein [Streptomyces sp. NBC_01012]|uniref:hypothetical protein n=1 Tax=Streptomyces sp. NBC_01012 TaxID=2903717 RepID=UPI00386473C5|nr:hypothetical protein OG623_24575 [Streptomyces sp. NBC_01012]
MAWDEWNQIKNDVAARRTDPMRLNQLPPAAGTGGAPDLASSPEKKQAAAKAINDDLEPDVERDGKHATESVKAAVKEFGARDGYGWDASGALKKAHRTWEQQVKALLGRLASEKHALSKTGIDFQNDDIGIGSQLAPPSPIDGY